MPEGAAKREGFRSKLNIADVRDRPTSALGVSPAKNLLLRGKPGGDFISGANGLPTSLVAPIRLPRAAGTDPPANAPSLLESESVRGEIGRRTIDGGDVEACKTPGLPVFGVCDEGGDDTEEPFALVTSVGDCIDADGAEALLSAPIVADVTEAVEFPAED